jgi:hypothetical protein
LVRPFTLLCPILCIKRKLKAFFKDLDIGYDFQTTILPNNERLTLTVLEIVESACLDGTKMSVFSFLKSQYPSFQSGEWNEMISDEPLYGVHIKPTPNSLSRDSSGNFEDVQLEVEQVLQMLHGFGVLHHDLALRNILFQDNGKSIIADSDDWSMNVRQ